MGLIAWYPLNGDTKDYSGYNRHGQGYNISWKNGKIGQCADLNGSGKYITVPHDEEISNKVFGQSDTFSFSAWVKMYNFANHPCIVAKAEHAHWSGSTAGLWVHSGGVYAIMGCSINTNAGGTYIRANCVPQLNTWQHITAVADGQWLSVYLNGEFIEKTSISGLTDTRRQNASPISIGRRRATTGDSPTYDLNDVRIYDHALSEKEIKEIAKAKVLHYTFNDFQEPTENLVDPVVGEWTGGSASTEVLNNDGYAARVFNFGRGNSLDWRRAESGNIEGFSVGDYITISFDYLKHEGRAGVGLRQYRSNGSSGRASTTFLPDTIYDQKRYSATWQATSDCNYFRVWVYVYNRDYNFDYDQYIDLRNLQVEIKPHATPFTPSSRSGKVMDCSGYNNHAELQLSTTPKWTEESKIGSGAYEFSLEQQIISNGLSFLSNVDGIENPISISLWTNGKSNVGAYDGIFNVCDSNDGYNGITCNITSDTAKRIRYWQDGGTTRAWSSPQSIGHWNHVVVVLSNNRTIVYENGEEVRNDAFTNPFSFGHRIHWGLYLYATSWYDGYLDDVRIYATALSDSDIKELYHTRASLDNGGNIFIPKFNILHNWNPEIQNYNLIENGDLEYESNFNFTSLNYNPSDKCIERTSASRSFLSSQFIPIKGNGLDSWDQYRLEGLIRGREVASRYYYMINCFDWNFRRISIQDVNARSNTGTFLTQDLIAGDEWVYMDNIINWFDNGTTNYHHAKGLALWHPTEDPPPYNIYKYTRRWRRVVEVDKTNNRVRLQTPFSGITIPSGSPAQNHMSGGTYSYIGASNLWTDLNNWDFRSALTSLTPNVNNMRYGTSYVKIGALYNRNAVDGTPTTQFKDMRFYNIESPQRTNMTIYKPSIDVRGEYNTFDVSEVGTTNGLVSWHPLNGDTKDYTEYRNDGVNNGATPTSGVIEGAYSFGSSHSIDVETITVNDDLTVSYWMNPQREATYRVLNSSDFRYCIWHTDNTRIQFDDRGQSGSMREIRFLEQILVDTWYHLVVVREQGITKAFLNGVYQGQTLNWTERIEMFKIGHRTNNTGWAGYTGKIGDVRIYNRALSDEEIGILYELTAPNEVKAKLTQDTLYLKGQIKEV